VDTREYVRHPFYSIINSSSLAALRGEFKTLRRVSNSAGQVEHRPALAIDRVVLPPPPVPASIRWAQLPNSFVRSTVPAVEGTMTNLETARKEVKSYSAGRATIISFRVRAGLRHRRVLPAATAGGAGGDVSGGVLPGGVPADGE
jgi:hypothetical protein